MVGLLSFVAFAAPDPLNGGDNEGPGDIYANYADLAAHEQEGVTYSVEAVARDDDFAVLAIHGGGIEQGSGQLAALVAGRDHSLYVFAGTKPDHNWDLHITSTHFDEPRALAIVRHSRACVSFHGYTDNATGTICLGGTHRDLSNAVKYELAQSRLPISVLENCPGLGGSDAANIANRCEDGGVQLEMSSGLRAAFLRDESLALRLASVIRAAMNDVPDDATGW